MTEIWKDIKGYEGFYKISNLGRVKSLKRKWTFGKGYIRKFGHNNDFILSPGEQPRSQVYLITLRKNGKKKTFTIHKLVAIHFIKNPENKSNVMFLDNNTWNCRADNLKWCTRKEQYDVDRWKGGKIAIKCLNNNTVYHSVKSASKQLKINYEYLRRSIFNHKFKVKGFMFAYQSYFDERMEKYKKGIA